MEYQIGPTRFKEEAWGKLFPAVRDRDWKKAAEQSHRKVPNSNAEFRNESTRKMFEEAYRIDNYKNHRD
jgi:hypothetical protein